MQQISAIGEDVEMRIVNSGVNAGHAKEGVEDMVMAQRSVAASVDAFVGNAINFLNDRGLPEQKRDVLLLRRSDRKRKAMEIEAVFSQRFPVVRYIEH